MEDTPSPVPPTDSRSRAGRPQSREAIRPAPLTDAVGFGSVALRVMRATLVLASVFTRVVLDRLYLRRLFCALTRHPYERLTWSRALRHAFERLGPAYVKFGQIIASSQGLFPEAMSREFQLCLDQVAPESLETIRRTIETDFEASLESVFHEFAQVPLAAASIAQVHTAKLGSGEDVVVKVQRPNLVRAVAADLHVMFFGARFVERFSRRMRLANLVGIVKDFSTTLSEEMDFRLEGLNMDEFNQVLGEGPNTRVVAPHVHWAYTTPRVLTMERFYGWRIDDVEKMKQLEDTEAELVVGVLAWMRTLLTAGFFHGDVHAGNMLYLTDGRIGFLDFGIVGRFTPAQRAQAMGFMFSLATGNHRQLAQVVWELSATDEREVNLDELGEELGEAYAPLVRGSMGNLDYRELLPGIQRVSMRHGLQLPREFVLLTKQLLYFDRYARLLAPKLNLFTDRRIMGQIAQLLPQAQGSSGPAGP